MSTLTPRITFPYAFAALSCLAGAALLSSACQSDPTEAVVVNDLPTEGAEPLTVYKVWYRSTLFLDPVAPGTQSDALLVGAGTEAAYALLAPAYDPEVGPSRLVLARTREVVRTEPGDTSRLVFSVATAVVGCGSAGPLSQADTDFITQVIFPGDFANVTYDAKTCTSTPIPDGDAGSPTPASEGGSDAADGG